VSKTCAFPASQTADIQGNDVSKEVVGQPPRQTGMPGMQDSLLLVGSAVGRTSRETSTTAEETFR
jgi:hypothetical protein